jgi:hypothetical protein
LAGLPTDIPLHPDVVKNCLHELARFTRKRPISGSDYVVNPAAKLPRTRSPAPTCSPEFPILLPQSEKDDIIREFRGNTNNSALQRFECSFCSAKDLFSKCKLRPTYGLDLSLLESAVAELRELSDQARIRCFRPETIKDGCYVLCYNCNKSVSDKKFKEIPARSYANGLWIGDVLVPDELKGLSLLEEQCICISSLY